MRFRLSLGLALACTLTACAHPVALAPLAGGLSPEMAAAARDNLPKNRSGKLTYLTYEALDNNLSGDLERVLNKLEVVGSTDGLNLLAQTDGDKKNDSYRYFLQQDKSPKVASPRFDLGEVNSASGSTLRSAVKWAFKTYPAKTTWVNLSSHGAGWMGALADDSPRGWMSLPTLASSIKSGAGHKVDLVSFDACLMATLEVAYELSDVADYMVGSEDVTYYWGRGYYDTMTKLARRPTMSPEAIAVDLVDTVHDRHGGTATQSLSVTAFDLSEAKAAVKAFDGLSKTLLTKAGPYRYQLKQAVKGLKPFVVGGEDTLEYRDLGNVLSAFSEIKDKELRDAIGKARKVIFKRGGLVVKTRNNHHERHATTGMSVYLPTGDYDHTYDRTAMAKATHWDEFLEQLCL